MTEREITVSTRMLPPRLFNIGSRMDGVPFFFVFLNLFTVTSEGWCESGEEAEAHVNVHEGQYFFTLLTNFLGVNHT